jgi:hypothetical protein
MVRMVEMISATMNTDISGEVLACDGAAHLLQSGWFATTFPLKSATEFTLNIGMAVRTGLSACFRRTLISLSPHHWVLS